MKDILEEIVAHKRKEVEMLYAPKPSLRQALLESDSGIIAEFKRRSPSKGWIKYHCRVQAPFALQGLDKAGGQGRRDTFELSAEWSRWNIYIDR